MRSAAKLQLCPLLPELEPSGPEASCSSVPAVQKICVVSPMPADWSVQASNLDQGSRLQQAWLRRNRTLLPAAEAVAGLQTHG